MFFDGVYDGVRVVLLHRKRAIRVHIPIHRRTRARFSTTVAWLDAARTSLSDQNVLKINFVFFVVGEIQIFE